jgi:3-hydroxybutyryl-CoA dehydratase
MDFNIGGTYKHNFILTEKIYDGFISISGDRNPLHTEPDFARSYGFREVVMHGNILNVFISYFVGECLPIKEVMIISQEIKYKLPVFINDELMFEASVAECSEAVKLVEFKFRFLKNDNSVVATGKIQVKLLG